MIKFSNFSLRRGNKLLFEEVNVIIHKQQHVGLVGANGCGKSSLFDVILDNLHADTGDFFVPDKLLIAHVKQETLALEESALEYVKKGNTAWYKISQAITQAENNDNHDELAHLYADLESINGYQVNSDASKLLSGLGFKESDHCRPVSDFSGGWRMRLNLAQALISPSDILLLDEPTNHLDLETVVWLEGWLRNYAGTLILISHDRDFLDQTCTNILHIQHQSIDAYTGNYSYFERARYEQQVLQQGQFEKQQKEVKHLEQFINRFRAQATKAKQVQSRVKALEKMQQVASVQVETPFSFKFHDIDKLPNPLLKLESINLGYGEKNIDEKIILSDINFTLIPGDRIGLLGHNGAGKSTFIKCLSSELQPKAGEVFVAKNLSIAYFAQHQLEQLDLNQTPYEFIRNLNPKASEQTIRNFLGSFGFASSKLDNKVDSPIAPFSGGEKARLVLSSLVYQKPSLLLLDEPTNHLDLEMRNALATALQQFQGSLIVIAHDRYLLSSITDTFYLLEDGSIRLFDGDLDDYSLYLNEKNKLVEIKDSESNSLDVQVSAKPVDKKAKRQLEAQRRKQLQPLNNQIKKLEKQIETYNKELESCDVLLADNDIYTNENKDKLKQVLAQQSDFQSKLEQAEEQWFEVSEEIENFSHSD